VKLLAALAVIGVAAVLLFVEPRGDDDTRDKDPQVERERGEDKPVGEGQTDVEELRGEFSGSACRRMAGLAARLAERERSAVGFLREFGREAAGIRPPPRAYGDLARGGRDLITGRGFLDRFDDGSQGQVRHFAGIAVASTFGGGGATRIVSILFRDDPLESPDGQLTEEGIAFADELRSGELELAETPAWLLDHLCLPS
jgi:hypothetical protein